MCRSGVLCIVMFMVHCVVVIAMPAVCCYVLLYIVVVWCVCYVVLCYGLFAMSCCVVVMYGMGLSVVFWLGIVCNGLI